MNLDYVLNIVAKFDPQLKKLKTTKEDAAKLDAAFKSLTGGMIGVTKGGKQLVNTLTGSRDQTAAFAVVTTGLNQKLQGTAAASASAAAGLTQTASAARGGANAMAEAEKATKRLKQASTGGNFAVLSLGQAFQDSAQFGMGFAQGMRAINNNVQTLAQSFVFMIQQQGSAAAAAKAMWASMMGIGGVMVLFSAVSAAVEFFATRMQKAAKANTDLADAMKGLIEVASPAKQTFLVTADHVRQLATEYDRQIKATKELTPGMLQVIALYGRGAFAAAKNARETRAATDKFVAQRQAVIDLARETRILQEAQRLATKAISEFNRLSGLSEKTVEDAAAEIKNLQRELIVLTDVDVMNAEAERDRLKTLLSLKRESRKLADERARNADSEQASLRDSNTYYKKQNDLLERRRKLTSGHYHNIQMLKKEEYFVELSENILDANNALSTFNRGLDRQIRAYERLVQLKETHYDTRLLKEQDTILRSGLDNIIARNERQAEYNSMLERQNSHLLEAQAVFRKMATAAGQKPGSQITSDTITGLDSNVSPANMLSSALKGGSAQRVSAHQYNQIIGPTSIKDEILGSFNFPSSELAPGFDRLTNTVLVSRDEWLASIREKMGVTELPLNVSMTEEMARFDENLDGMLDAAERHKMLLEDVSTSFFGNLQGMARKHKETIDLTAQVMGQSLGQAGTAFMQLAQTGETTNKRLFETGKAFATASAIVNTAQAVTKALAEGGPFLGPVLAASALAAGMAQVATIRSTTPGGSGSVSGASAPSIGTYRPAGFGSNYQFTEPDPASTRGDRSGRVTFSGPTFTPASSSELISNPGAPLQVNLSGAFKLRGNDLVLAVDRANTARSQRGVVTSK